MRTMMLAALAALLPCAAWAAPTPLATDGIPVDPNRSVSGHFDAAGTQTWRLYLRQGRNYALWGSNDAVQEVGVQAAGGRSLARFELNGGGDQPTGAGFRAPYTGLYAVVVTQPASCRGQTPCVGTGGVGDGGYSLSAGRDCPDDPSTPCHIAAGQRIDGLRQDFLADSDWFRTTLRAGVPYRVGLAAPGRPGYDARVAIHDARGRTLARASWFNDGGGAPAVTFTARTAGAYYVEVSVGSAGPLGVYSLALSR